MKTIDKLKSILEESDDPIRDKIKKLITEMEKEQPKLLDEGWFHTSSGYINEFNGRIFDSGSHKRAAVRPTQKEAEYASLVNELWNKRKRAQDILCPGYRFVVGKGNWSIMYDNHDESYDVESRCQTEDLLSVYFDTKEHALEAEEMFDITDLRERVRNF